LADEYRFTGKMTHDAALHYKYVVDVCVRSLSCPLMEYELRSSLTLAVAMGMRGRLDSSDCSPPAR
jgi:hypothetical protein